MDHSLQEITNKNSLMLDSFANDFPELITVVDTNIFIGKAYVSVISQTSIYNIPIELSLIIQRQHGYYENSVVLMTQGNFDEALALLRLAMELSRDLLVLSEKPDLISLWKNREKEYQKYRKKFKFKHEHPANKYAHELYKFTSRYGVHGHQTTLMNSSEIKEIESENNISELTVSTIKIADNLTTWFSAFFPIYGNIIDCLGILNPPTLDTIEVEKDVMELCQKNVDLVNST